MIKEMIILYNHPHHHPCSGPPEGCLSWEAGEPPRCTGCVAGRVLQEGACVTGCSKGRYLDAQQQMCRGERMSRQLSIYS